MKLSRLKELAESAKSADERGAIESAVFWEFDQAFNPATALKLISALEEAKELIEDLQKVHGDVYSWPIKYKELFE